MLVVMSTRRSHGCSAAEQVESPWNTAQNRSARAGGSGAPYPMALPLAELTLPPRFRWFVWWSGGPRPVLRIESSAVAVARALWPRQSVSTRRSFGIMSSAPIDSSASAAAPRRPATMLGV